MFNYDEILKMDLDEAMKTYADLAVEFGPIIQRIELLKSRIKELVLDGEETVERYGVKAIYRAPHTRRTVDKKELERMSTIYPEVGKVFKTTKVKASVQVK